MTSTETFPVWLNRMLEKRGWSRKRLADYLGHSDATTVRRWLRGQNQPHRATLLRLYDLFGEEYGGTDAPGLPSDLAAMQDQLAALRAEIRRLGDLLEAASAARSAQVDQVVQGQAKVVAAVEVALRAIPSSPATLRTQREPR